MIDVPVLAFSLAAYFLHESSVFPKTCTARDVDTVNALLIANFTVWSAAFLVDLLTVRASFRTRFLQRNKQLHALLAVRGFVTMALFGLILISTIWSSLWRECLQNPSETDDSGNQTSGNFVHLSRIARGLYVWDWLSVAFSVTFWYCAYAKDRPVSPARIRRWLRWLCCCAPDNIQGHDVFSGIADMTALLLSTVDRKRKRDGFGNPMGLRRFSRHLVLTDLAVGMILVNFAQQQLTAKKGHRLRVPEGTHRWGSLHDPAFPSPATILSPNANETSSLIIDPPTPVAGGLSRVSSQEGMVDLSMSAMAVSISFPSLVSEEDETRSSSAVAEEGGGKEVSGEGKQEKEEKETKEEKKMGPSVVLEIRDDPFAAVASKKESPRSAAGSPDWSMLEAVQNGVQPLLLRQDWERLRLSRELARHAFAVYGWALRTLMNPCCAAKCECSAGCGHTFGRHRIYGRACCCAPCCSGSSPSSCSTCRWDLNVFVKQTRIDPKDIWLAQTSSNLKRRVYVVSLDVPLRALVIAIRGTMSLSDTLTDLDARTSKLDAYGYPGHFGHAGILRSAKTILRDLTNKGIIDKFKTAPECQELSLYITGHSLGAGTSILLTLLLQHLLPGRNVHCVAFAPPLVVDEALSQSAFARGHITSVVFQDDVVSHLSPRTAMLLMAQMTRLMAAVAGDKHSKFDLLRLSREPDSFQLIGDMTEHLSDAYEESEQDFKSHDARLADTAKELEVPMGLAGRIYHILSAPAHHESCGSKCQRNCMCCPPQTPARTVVYPASPESFKEIVVTRNMFLDHMPYNYLLDSLDFPGETSASSSPAPYGSLAGSPSPDHALAVNVVQPMMR